VCTRGSNRALPCGPSTSPLEVMRFVLGTAAVGLALGVTLKLLLGGTPIGWCMLVTLAALPLVGVLVTIDDDLPGGWSNPGGKTRPPWFYWQSWADLAARAAISGLGFAIDAGWYTPVALVWWVVGAVGAAASVWLHRRGGRISAHDL